MTGRLIAVVGPSGVGKDTVMAALVAADPRLALVRRVITRPSDAGGEDFDGVDRATFETMRDAGAFALWWSAHELSYGIPVEVDAALAAGRDMWQTCRAGFWCRRRRGLRSCTLSLWSRAPSCWPSGWPPEAARIRRRSRAGWHGRDRACPRASRRRKSTIPARCQRRSRRRLQAFTRARHSG